MYFEWNLFKICEFSNQTERFEQGYEYFSLLKSDLAFTERSHAILKISKSWKFHFFYFPLWKVGKITIE